MAMISTNKIGHTNKVIKFPRPDEFSSGVAARLPEAYKKFWYEWKLQEPEPVHYIPEPGKWKRNPETGVVTPVQNIPISLKFPKESHEGIWGGEGVVKGFQKRKPNRRRVPHFWFPSLMRSVVYSEVLNKHLSTVVTQRTLTLIHNNKGLDHYLLKTPACDLQSLLALKLKRKILLSLLHKDLYPGDSSKKEEIYNTYKHYVDKYTEEDIEWYGLSFGEAVTKQRKLEEAQNIVVPLKNVYRAQLIEKLEAAGIEGVKVLFDDDETEQKRSWLTRINPFSSRKQDS